jgi:hypothetical protein
LQRRDFFRGADVSLVLTEEVPKVLMLMRGKDRRPFLRQDKWDAGATKPSA